MEGGLGVGFRWCLVDQLTGDDDDGIGTASSRNFGSIMEKRNLLRG